MAERENGGLTWRITEMMAGFLNRDDRVKPVVAVFMGKLIVKYTFENDLLVKKGDVLQLDITLDEPKAP